MRERKEPGVTPRPPLTESHGMAIRSLSQLGAFYI